MRIAVDQSYNCLTKSNWRKLSLLLFQWDHRNRLTSVTHHNADDSVVKLIEYTYDVFDRRISRSVTENGNVSRQNLIYDGSNILLILDHLGGAITHRFLHGPAADQVLLEERFTPGQPVQTLWPLADHLGTARVILGVNVAFHFEYAVVIVELKVER